MQNSHRKLFVQAALPILILSTSSCASLGNFILSGKWEDPNAPEVKPMPSAEEAPASDKAPEKVASAPAAKPVEEPKRQVVPIDTVFTHGSWFLLRTSRALYGWTGKGESFRLFAIDLHVDANCWGSQQANRPEAEHCPDSDGPAAAITRIVNGQKVENLFAGFEKAPWKTAQSGSPLTEGTYDLPESSGKEKGSFTLECKANEITVHTSRGALFTIPSASNEFLVDGERAELFDGCTDAKGVLGVYEDVGIGFGQKKCGILRRQTDSTVSLIVDKVELEFSQTSKAPNIAKDRAKAAELRKVAAAHKAQVTLELSGDASHTLIAGTGKRADGVGFSMVEGVRTFDGIHLKCEGKIEKVDAAWVRTAKQVCGGMVTLK